MNPNGDVSGAVAQAYLLPPLQGHHEAYTFAAAQVVEGDDSQSKQQALHSAPSSPLHDGGAKAVAGNSSGGDGGELAAAEISAFGFWDVGMFRDVAFALLFAANVLWVVGTACSTLLGFAGMPEEEQRQAGAGVDISGLKAVATAVLLLSVFAITLAASGFLLLLVRYSEQLISAAIYLSIATFAALCVLSLLSGVLFFACIFGACTAFVWWWLKRAQGRVAFASTVLKTAVLALHENQCELMTVSMLMLFTEVVWTLVWAVASMGTYYSLKQAGASHGHSNSNADDDTSGLGGDGDESRYTWAAALLLCQLFWGIEVCKNVISSTVSGTMACWWFTPERRAPVRGAVFRALSTSFGCICLGSLFVAALSVVRVILNLMRDSLERSTSSRNNSRANPHPFRLGAMCLAELLLRMVERAFQYFNRYAFCYNAAFGCNFLTSGQRVMSLFSRRGWTALINDDLIRHCLGLLTLGVGLCTAACAGMLSVAYSDHLKATGLDSPWELLVAAGFFIGCGVGTIMTNIVDSGVVSVFVFFAEDPRVFATNHPQLYQELATKLIDFNPESAFHITGDQYQVSPLSLSASAPPLAIATQV